MDPSTSSQSKTPCCPNVVLGSQAKLAAREYRDHGRHQDGANEVTYVSDRRALEFAPKHHLPGKSCKQHRTSRARASRDPPCSALRMSAEVEGKSGTVRFAGAPEEPAYTTLPTPQSVVSLALNMNDEGDQISTSKKPFWFQLNLESRRMIITNNKAPFSSPGDVDRAIHPFYMTSTTSSEAIASFRYESPPSPNLPGR